MSVPRADFAAVLLPSFKVLLIGGQTSPTTATATVDLYDEVANTITPAPPMSTARMGHSATMLHDGRVLVAGGVPAPHDSPALTSAEIYDPATNTWRAAASMAQQRSHHGAALLADGRVFVAGGDGGGGASPNPTTPEIYDPASNTWTTAPTNYGMRPNGPTVTQLADGRVLTFGGVAQVEPGNSVDLYDPATGQAGYSYFMTTDTSWSTAALIDNRTVLIAGGQQTYNPAGALNTTSIYDPAQDKQGCPTCTPWVVGPPMNVGHCHYTMINAQNGLIFAIGGRCGGSESIGVAEIYDPKGKRWTTVAPLLEPRGFHVAVRLGDLKTLVAGGVLIGGAIAASIEIYTPA
jgi:hypothetical protein